jgi:hypothetical protein
MELLLRLRGLGINLVERLQQIFEARSVINRPGAVEGRPKQVQVPLSQKAEGHDASVVTHLS